MRVDHESYPGTDRAPHELRGFQTLLRSQRWTHLVGSETHLRDCSRFVGVTLRRHVHSGAAVELDAIALAPAYKIRHRRAFKFRRKIDQRNFDGVVRLLRLQIRLKLD